MSLPLEGWKNVKGTSDRRCSCGSWKKHWLKFSGKNWYPVCSELFCSNDAEVGAHVFNPKVSKEEYIIPMCKDCNSIEGEFSIKPGIVLVNANVSETCGRK